jgi:Stress responsive A/B Barrel Domain
MIYHQIRVSIRPDAEKEKVDTALEMLNRMGREIEVVDFFCVGRDFGGNFDFGALYALKDLDAYRTYMFHPLPTRPTTPACPSSTT